MTGQIKIFDTTLRDGEQAPGCSMHLNEKMKIAGQLERLKVDVIEAGFPIASQGDFEAVMAIASSIKDCGVAALARAKKVDITTAADALKNAALPRIHTFIATSPLHMSKKLKLSPDEVIDATANMVSLARNLCAEVEFSAEDATRSAPEFLCRVFETAIKAGATIINVPDTVGYTTPMEYADLITYLINNIPSIDQAIISVHCHDDLGMAVANSLAAARAGARQVECTINGIGERAGNAALEEIVMATRTRHDYYGLSTGVETGRIHRVSKLVSTLTGVPVPPNKAIVGNNAFAHESGIHQHGVMADKSTYEIMTPESVGLTESQMVLGKHSGRHAFDARTKQLGFSLSPEEINKAFVRFKNLADQKKTISDFDIEALVHNEFWTSKQIYTLEQFIINSGNTITTTANVKLKKNGEYREDVASGDGPMDAAFKAMEKVLGTSYKLEDYALKSVSEGKDAQGEVTLKLRSNGRVVTGKGLSTDVIEAGIKAYVNAVNRILFHEELLAEVRENA